MAKPGNSKPLRNWLARSLGRLAWKRHPVPGVVVKDSLADVRVWPERFASTTSKRSAQLPTFPFGRMLRGQRPCTPSASGHRGRDRASEWDTSKRKVYRSSFAAEA